ncbi:MAG: M12 family metallopeptidase [Phycisphaerales bacterium]
MMCTKNTAAPTDARPQSGEGLPARFRGRWLAGALLAAAGAARAQDYQIQVRGVAGGEPPPRGLGPAVCDVGGAAPEGNHVANLWPGGIVPYRFNANVNAENQQRAVDAMAAIEAVCDADFIPWAGQAAYININDHPSANNSCVGYSGGVCTVNIHDWPFRGTIIHEFGHSLGLHHEQKRADRDQYVQVNLANTCNAANNYSVAGTVFGPYDFESIMHYDRYGWTRDGSAVMTVLPAHAEWKYYCGDGDYLSNGDIWVLTQLYGGPRPPRLFALTVPAHRARVGTSWVPSFQWGTSELADSYHLQVDDAPSFTSPEIDVSVGGTSYAGLVPLPAGRAYYWRVRAVNTTGETEARPRPVHSFLTESGAPPILYVDDDAAPGGTGGSWTAALEDLAEALTIADCAAGGAGRVTEIRVGQGVYTPDRGSGDRDSAFRLTGGVQIKGGYAGVGAPNPDDRDIHLYPTTLTGDLAGDDEPGFVNYGENSRRVVTALGVSEACTLDGLSITAGNADGVPGGTASGSGINSQDSHLILRDCRLTLCSANAWGGGINTFDGGSLEATGTLFEGNRTTSASRGGGSGLNAALGSAITLIGCTFRGNAGWQAAGANITDASPVCVVRDCVFEDNVALQWVGGLQIFRRNAVVDRCTFRGNVSLSPTDGYAGGFGAYGLSSCGVGCIVTVANCLFEGNTAGRTGGAINNDDDGTLSVINCTIAGNAAPPGLGGGISNTGDFGAGASMTIANSIVRANTGGQIVNTGTGTSTAATYSNVEGGFGGFGNIMTDPLFVNTAAGNYRLAPYSPSADAGSNILVPVGITQDLDGAARFREDPWVPNTGVGPAPIVDIGAYERGSSCYPDCNESGTLTVADFGCFQGKYVLGDLYADCNASGTLSVADFGCFQGKYAVGCP